MDVTKLIADCKSLDYPAVVRRLLKELERELGRPPTAAELLEVGHNLSELGQTFSRTGLRKLRSLPLDVPPLPLVSDYLERAQEQGPRGRPGKTRAKKRS